MNKQLESREGLRCGHEESRTKEGDFPGGPVAKTLRSQCRGPGLIPGQGTRSHLLQLRAHIPQLNIPHVQQKTPHAATKVLRAATKTRHGK